MPRPPRIDEANGLYHALNRGNARATIFHKPEDYQAFERVLAAGLERYQIQLFCYVLMPNHWHLILRPTIDGEMSRFMRWITATHTMRYHAHYQTGGQGHLYQGRFKSFPIQDDEHFLTVCRYVERNPVRAELVTSAEKWPWSSLRRWSQTREPDPKLLTPWPIPRLPRWLERVNTPLSAPELNDIRESVQKGKPLGDPAWTSATAQRLNLNSTLRPRGRPKVKPVTETKTSPDPFVSSLFTIDTIIHGDNKSDTG